MQDLGKPFALRRVESKREEDKEEQLAKQIDLTKPYLTNLNKDPFLNGKIKYSLNKEQIRVGTKNDSTKPEIVMHGLGIKSSHALFFYEGKDLYLMPMDVIS